MDTPYDYRVKFKDIRVRPSAEEASRAKAKGSRVCDHKGCDLAGEHRAPKHGAQNEFHYFCARHASEYNKSWNFFDGMTEAEAAAFMHQANYGHRPTWRFGQGPVGGKKAADAQRPHGWRGAEFMPGGETPEAAKARKKVKGRTRLQVRALEELDLAENATATEIRERYSEYVKRFHPDANGGDRSSEHKLARVIRAFKTLKAAGLTQT